MESKARMIEVAGDELAAIKAAGLGGPHVFSNRVGSIIHFWCDADELRAYRSHASTGLEP
jgi:hypothetical protein